MLLIQMIFLAMKDTETNLNKWDIIGTIDDVPI